MKSLCIKQIIVGLVFLAAVDNAGVVAQILPDTQIRNLFVQAMSQTTDAQNETGVDSPELRAYALYPYLESNRIIAQLDSPESFEEAYVSAQAHLARYAGSAIELSLRRDLLISLSRLKRWPEFLESYSAAAANSTRECEYLAARVALGEVRGLHELIESKWLTANRLPSECESAFEWLRGEGRLDTDLTIRRIELLLENDQAAFAAVIARRLPTAQADIWQARANALLRPLETVDSFVAGDLPESVHAVLFSAWQNAATNDPDAALSRFERFKATPGFESEEPGPYTAALALGLAWDRHPDALRIFAAIPRNEYDDYVGQWHARAALWDANWPTAKQALESLSRDIRDTAAWRYWDARLIEISDGIERARLHYEALLPNDNYYSAAASARLGIGAVPHPRSIDLQSAIYSQLEQDIALVRSRELFLTGYTIHAIREWQLATADLDPAALRQAALLAAQWGWHERAVTSATAAEEYHDYPLLYPRNYSEEIRDAANATGIPDSLAFGLVRQESLFRPDAISAAGAVGLMQVLPETARRVMIQGQTSVSSVRGLQDARTNTLVGSRLLADWINRFGDQLPVALAAYNAGPGAAARWLPDTPIDSDIWIENIPFNETRAYVRRVLWHAVVYAWLETQNPVAVDYLRHKVSKPDVDNRQ